MKNILKKLICVVFTLTFMFANANIALAGDFIVLSSEVLEPELHKTASNGSYDNIEQYIGDVDDFQDYLLECILADNSNLTNANGRGYIDISQYRIPYTETMRTELFNLIWYESPELFRINGGLGFKYTLTGMIVALTPIYTIEKAETFQEQYKSFVDSANKMLEGIKENDKLNDVEKALLIHDRIATSCEYDNENLINDTVPMESYTAFGVLNLGKAVCMGYALAYDYLLENVGIEAEYCASEALNHAWNIVYIDNKPYHVDITHDDPVWDVSGRVLHNNFLLSTEALKATGSHTATDYKTTPVDTTYDGVFWQNSETAFQLLNDKLYYIDNISNELKVMDDISCDEPEVLTELDYKWTTDDGGVYLGNYSKLAVVKGQLFYSTPTEIYNFNPETDTTEKVLSEEDIIKATGSDAFRIYGLSGKNCVVYGEYATSPNYTLTTKENSFSINYHNPEDEWKIAVNPTHITQGEERKYCIDCGDVVDVRYLDILDEHKWGEAYMDPENPPTCTEKGILLRDCIYDGCTAKKTEEIEATGHTVEIVKIKSPTCTEAGYTGDSACTICKEVIEKGEAINPVGHKTTIVNTKEATFDEDGYTGDSKCSVCGAITEKGKIIPRLVIGLTAPVVTANITEQGVKLNWGAVDNAIEYKVYRKVYNASTKKWDSKWKRIKILTGTEYVDGSVKLGTKYKYLVKAVNRDVTKNSKSTSTISFKISPTPKAYLKSTSIKIKWTPVVSATEYRIYRAEYNESKKKYSSFKKVKTVSGATKEWTDKNVTSGKKYKYCIKAVNGSVVCDKKVSNTLYFLTKTTAKSAKAKTGLKVSWTAVKGATSFKIYRSELQDGSWTKFTQVGKVGSKSLSFTDTTVISGVQYKYKVKAIKSSTGQTSSETSAILYLQAPTVIAVKAADGIDVIWIETEGATEYVVYRKTYDAKKKKWSGFKKQTTITGTEWKDTTAKPGVKYKYCVRAKNGDVTSAYLSTETVKR